MEWGPILAAMLALYLALALVKKRTRLLRVQGR
jgi:hypothetical protein